MDGCHVVENGGRQQRHAAALSGTNEETDHTVVAETRGSFKKDFKKQTYPVSKVSEFFQRF
jgi:hypothetical protein